MKSHQILHTARLASASYQDRELLSTTIHGYVTLLDSTSGCQALVTRTDDGLQVTFRGTESPLDAYASLLIRRSTLDLPRKQVLVHRGYLEQFLSVRSQIWDLLGPDDRVITFSGHSLGGALATIASLDLAAHFPLRQVRCVTFGSPRVGDSRFAREFKRYVPHSLRFVHEYDPIPTFPSAY